jgi:hypothetical protein
VPPAWSTGKAEPWPSQQEAREARERGKRETSGEPHGGSSDELAADREIEPEPVAAGQGRLHPSSKKRKRKRRS